MIKRIFVMAIVVLASISLIAPKTYAIITLYLEDPLAGPPIIVQGNPSGFVSYSGTVPAAGGGTWNINLTNGTTKPAIGSPVKMQMELNSINVTSAGGGTLNIKLSEDNFGPGAGGFSAQIGGTMGSGAGSSVTYDTYLDAGNSLFVNGTPLTHQIFNSSPFAGTASTSVGPIAFPFSLTQDVTIVHTGNGQTSFDASLCCVPEPSSALLLLGLLGGMVFLKRKKES